MRAVAAFGLCLVLFDTFASDSGLPALMRARHDADAVARRIATLRADNARLRRDAEALRRDPRAIELVARETLGLARPGELVVTRPQ